MKKGLNSGYSNAYAEFISIWVTSASIWEKSGLIVSSIDDEGEKS